MKSIYADKSKACERYDLWDGIHYFPGGINGPRFHALILGGPTCFEAKMLMNNYNVPEDKILVVEADPKVMAQFDQSCRDEGLTIPDEKKFVGLLSDVAPKIKAAGHLVSCAHLDFCSTANGARNELRLFVRSGVLRYRSMMAVTVLSGRDRGVGQTRPTESIWREYKYDFDFQTLTPGNATRANILMDAMSTDFCDGEVLDAGKYWNQTSKQPMFWFSFELHSCNQATQLPPGTWKGPRGSAHHWPVLK